MQSAKKVKALSVLSMAAAATVGLGFQATPGARAATLNMYYNSGFSSAQKGVISYGTSSTSSALALGHDQTVAVSSIVPTTVNVPLGDYVVLGINAVVTNNVNALAGQSLEKSGATTKTVAGTTQPTNLGLNELAYYIDSTDIAGTTLTPSNNGSIRATFGNQVDYDSTASLASVTTAVSDVGDVLTGGAPTYTSGYGDGAIGAEFAVNPLANAAINAKTQAPGPEQSEPATYYAAATASATNSQEGNTNLIYTANKVGTVTLSALDYTPGTEYWSYRAGAAITTGAGATNIYRANYFNNPGDSVVAMPVLVINIIGSSVPSTHPLISLTAAAPTSYGTLQGTATMTGSHSSYSVGTAGPFAATPTGYIEASLFNPATDEEIYAIDVATTGTTLAQLVSDINNGDSAVTASTGVTAALSYDGLPGVTGSSPFGSQYNLFLDSPSGPTGGTGISFLGIDFSSSNDSNLSGVSFTEVAAVPEPMSLGLLALSGLGLMARRNRRKT